MRRHPWLFVALLALAGVMGLGAFPARAYVDQLHQREDLARQVEALASANRQLESEKARLSTDEEIERLARLRYQLVRPGEEAYVVLPDGSPPTVPDPPVTDGPGPPSPAPSFWDRVWSAVTSLF
ncbi:MAG: septum formation initiator family protein [Actinomycetota bacterium]